VTEREPPNLTDDDIDDAMNVIILPWLNGLVATHGSIPSVMPLALVAMAANLVAQWCDGEEGYQEGLVEIRKCLDNYSKYCLDFAKKTPEEKALVRAPSATTA
jgi:hypothetical protein